MNYNTTNVKITAVAATSTDGFIASPKHPHPAEWTSKEDKVLLKHIVTKFDLLVYGKNTYETYGKMLSEGTLRVILTNDPDAYASDLVPGQLEFYSLSPEQFVAKFEKQYSNCLVLGGAYVYETFFKAGLIDELYLSVEPVTFGNGTPFISEQLRAELLDTLEPEITKLNEKGTILKHYILKK